MGRGKISGDMNGTTSTQTSTEPAPRVSVARGKSKRKRPSNNPAGRPVGSGRRLAEATVLVTAPAVMLAAAALAAGAEGVSVREWWRRAGRVRLGWHAVAADVAE